jgi:hypothetical protein
MDSASFILGQFSSFVSLMVQGAAIVGLAIFGTSIYGFYKQTTFPQNYPFGRNVSMFFAGTLLIISGSAFQAFDNSLMGTDDNIGSGSLYMDRGALEELVSNGIETGSATNGTQILPAKTAALVIGAMYLIGVISFLKGIYLLKDAGEMGSNNGKEPIKSAIVYMISGVIAVNINSFGCVLGSTFGTTLFCSA